MSDELVFTCRTIPTACFLFVQSFMFYKKKNFMLSQNLEIMLKSCEKMKNPLRIILSLKTYWFTVQIKTEKTGKWTFCTFFKFSQKFELMSMGHRNFFGSVLDTIGPCKTFSGHIWWNFHKKFLTWKMCSKHASRPVK